MKEEISLYLPVKGELLSLKEINNFIRKDIVDGLGVGIIPSSDIFYAPVSGKVILLGDNLNNIGIDVDGKFTLFIQCGINTECLNGRGFASYVKVGDEITVGDKMLYMDRDFVSNKCEITCPILITNRVNVEKIKVNYEINDEFQEFMKVILK